MSTLSLAQHAPPSGAFLRLPQVRALTGYSRASIYRGMAAKTFPQSIPLSRRLTVWLEVEVREWMAQQVAHHRYKA